MPEVNVIWSPPKRQGKSLMVEQALKEAIARNAEKMKRQLFDGPINCRCVVQKPRVLGIDLARVGLTADDLRGFRHDSLTDTYERETEMTDVSSQYMSLVREVMDGPTEVNERTGVEIKMLGKAATIEADLSGGWMPVVNNRRMYPHIAAAETAWQFMGTQSPDWILGKAPKLWSKFVEDGLLKTAYGYRWQHHFGRNQLQRAIEELRTNPTNRQLYISAWDPSEDGLGGPQPKNVPCPVGFSLSTCEGHLNLAVFIRSSDVFVGLPYDTMCYALTLDAIAASTDLTPGQLHITLAHPHIYEPHWKFTNKSEGFARSQNVEPQLPGWDVDMIVQDPDTYVDLVKRLSKRQGRVDWDPAPIVVE